MPASTNRDGEDERAELCKRLESARRARCGAVALVVVPILGWIVLMHAVSGGPDGGWAELWVFFMGAMAVPLLLIPAIALVVLSVRINRLEEKLGERDGLDGD